MINLVVICGITLLLRLPPSFFSTLIAPASSRITGFVLLLPPPFTFGTSWIINTNVLIVRNSFDIGRTARGSVHTAWGASTTTTTTVQLTADWLRLKLKLRQFGLEQRIQLSFGSGQRRITARDWSICPYHFLLAEDQSGMPPFVAAGGVARFAVGLLSFFFFLFFAFCSFLLILLRRMVPLVQLLLKLLLRCPSGTLKTDLRALINFNIASMPRFHHRHINDEVDDDVVARILNNGELI